MEIEPVFKLPDLRETVEMNANLQNPFEPNFYYHPDHLGSSSYITEDNGHITQTLAYMPYGENFVDLSFGSPYESPYKYNGKEKDEETGYNYYGARYYWSDGSIWLSVDPLADKYPWISPYAYCNNNPIVLKDPDGKDGIAVVNTSTKTITLTAKYFVVTEPLKGSDRHIPTYTTAYSPNEISGMQSSINNQLNRANYQVTEGEYSGYNVKFNLEFVDGGNRTTALTSAKIILKKGFLREIYGKKEAL